MQLNKTQQRALLRAKELRDKPFPIVGSILRSSKSYFILLVLFGGYSWFAWSLGVIEFSMVGLGMLLGIVVRDVGWFRVHARMWPVNVEITDWDKVDKLLEQKNET